MIKLNKKADEILFPKFITIILAVLCILFLFYLGYLLVGILKDQTRTEQAKASLEEVIRKVSLVEEGKQTDFLYLAPRDFYFKSKKAGDIDQCKYMFCLCLCNDKDCSDLNVCKESKKSFVIQSSKGLNLENEKIKTASGFIILNEKEEFILRLNDK